MHTKETSNTDNFYESYLHIRDGTTPSLDGVCPTTMAPSEFTLDQDKFGLLTLYYITRKFSDKYREKGTVEECIFFLK